MSIPDLSGRREQQINRFPAAGGSSGSGSYFTDPEINPHSQVWQTPVRHDQRISERLGMGKTGHKARAMFDRYSIASTKELLWVYYGLLILSRPVIVWNIVAVVINFWSVAVSFRFAPPRRESLIGGEHLVRAAECAAGRDRCGCGSLSSPQAASATLWRRLGYDRRRGGVR